MGCPLLCGGRASTGLLSSLLEKTPVLPVRCTGPGFPCAAICVVFLKYDVRLTLFLDVSYYTMYLRVFDTHCI